MSIHFYNTVTDTPHSVNMQSKCRDSMITAANGKNRYTERVR